MSRRTLTAFTVAALAAAALALGACAGTDDTGGGTGTGGASAPAGSTFPVTVGSLTLDKRPEKIVSLSPSLTESLFAVGAGKQIVAADELSNYPADAPKTKLSGFKPNAEAVAAYQPDLVVLSDDIGKVSDALKTLKIPVFQAPAAKTLDEAYAQIEDLGKLTGHGTEAADVAKRMKEDIAKLVADLPQRSKKLTYYYELDPNLYSVTSKTFIGAVLALAGLANVADPADAAGGGYPQLNAESLVKANPDLIFLADSRCCQQNADTVKARPGWSGITAVKTGQIVPLDDDIASRWGPRVVDLVRAVTEAVAKVPVT